jgi:hypothetical protein
MFPFGLEAAIRRRTIDCRSAVIPDTTETHAYSRVRP